jgi:hypothetical protein
MHNQAETLGGCTPVGYDLGHAGHGGCTPVEHKLRRNKAAWVHYLTAAQTACAIIKCNTAYLLSLRLFNWVPFLKIQLVREKQNHK